LFPLRAPLLGGHAAGRGSNLPGVLPRRAAVGLLARLRRAHCVVLGIEEDHLVAGDRLALVVLIALIEMHIARHLALAVAIGLVAHAHFDFMRPGLVSHGGLAVVLPFLELAVLVGDEILVREIALI